MNPQMTPPERQAAWFYSLFELMRRNPYHAIQFPPTIWNHLNATGKKRK